MQLAIEGQLNDSSIAIGSGVAVGWGRGVAGGVDEVKIVPRVSPPSLLLGDTRGHVRSVRTLRTGTSGRVFLQFGQAMGVIAWESLDDFPDARKIVYNATTTWPFFIFIVFIPQCMLAFSLLGTPYFCEGVTIRESCRPVGSFTSGGVVEGESGDGNAASPGDRDRSCMHHTSRRLSRNSGIEHGLPCSCGESFGALALVCH